MGYSLAVAAEACSAESPSGSAGAVEVTASCPEKDSGPAATAEDASFLAYQAAADSSGVEEPTLPMVVADLTS